MMGLGFLFKMNGETQGLSDIMDQENWIDNIGLWGFWLNSSKYIYIKKSIHRNKINWVIFSPNDYMVDNTHVCIIVTSMVGHIENNVASFEISPSSRSIADYDTLETIISDDEHSELEISMECNGVKQCKEPGVFIAPARSQFIP
jgi:hypothetical protein